MCVFLCVCESDAGFQCDHCGASFTYHYDLKRHINVKHKVDQQLFSCTLCDFTSKYKNSMKMIKVVVETGSSEAAGNLGRQGMTRL